MSEPHPPRPEARGYTAFLQSLAAMLCVAAVLQLNPIHGGNSATLVTKRQLHQLTPVAQKSVRRQQSVAWIVESLTPFIVLSCLAAAIALNACVLSRLRRQEQREERRRDLELEMLRRELEHRR